MKEYFSINTLNNSCSFEAYVDGSCDNKRKTEGAGIGIVLVRGEEVKAVGGRIDWWCNSARAEIIAILTLLQLLKKEERCIVYSDNKYVVDSFNEGWLEKWERESWIGRINSDLWKEVLTEWRYKKKWVQVRWVKGHNSNEYNVLADRFANKARRGEL